MRKLYVVVCALLVCAAFPVSAGKQGDTVIDTSTSAILKHLRGVGVQVAFQKDDRRDGPSTDAIQTDVELKLREAHIKVLTPKEVNASIAPLLLVSVACEQITNTTLYSLTVFVFLAESVNLVRSPHTRVLGAITWLKQIHGVSESAQLSSETRQQVKDLVNIFCNDYLKANPL